MKKTLMAEKPMRVIEPSVVRLTSDETRMLMKCAVAGKTGVHMPYNAAGVKELGLVVPARIARNEKQKLRLELAAARKRCLGAKTWASLVKLKAAAGRAEDALRYYHKKDPNYVLTEAGKKLVASITIRRR